MNNYNIAFSEGSFTDFGEAGGAIKAKFCVSKPAILSQMTGFI